MYCSCSACCC